MVKTYRIENTTDKEIEIPDLLILQPGIVDVGLNENQVEVVKKIKGVRVSELE